MTYVDILAKFLEMFPMYQTEINAYIPYGANTIIVEFKDKNTYRFTYYNDNDWTFGRYHL